MNSQIRKMTEKDISEVVRIIRLHNSFDGRCADRYFVEYFDSSNRIESSDRDATPTLRLCD